MSEWLDFESYIAQNKLKEDTQHENFTCKRQITRIKDELLEESQYVLRLKGKNYKMWKPSRPRLSRAVKDVVDQTEAN